MDNSLSLKCIQCNSYLSEFRWEVAEYRCAQCEHVYRFANGILDCIGEGHDGNGTHSNSDLVSSFAQPMADPFELDALNLRLQPLYLRLSQNQNNVWSMYLDVGCGYGPSLLAAASKFRMAVGVNMELGELEGAAVSLKEHGIHNVLLVHASAQALPFMPAQFAVVSSVQVLEHVRSPETVLAQLKLMLMQPGYLYLSVPNRFTLRAEPHTQLPWIGFLPTWLAQRYAAQKGKLEEYRSVRLISVGQLSTWLRTEFGASYEFVRSGYHQSMLGRTVQRVWHIPIVSLVARRFVGDIEVIAWR